MAAGGATYGDWDGCNDYVGDCLNSADNFNNSGDDEPAPPFDGFESGHPGYCQIAHHTACNVLAPQSCAQ